ncbi:MAG TPA: ABC transporter ATP-binding protein [Candidatus Binatia bacterium]|jgi:ATP-binding cassette subfamily B protein
MAGRRYSTLAVYRRLLRETGGYRLHLAAIFFLSLLAAPLTLLIPIPLKIAVDNVIGSRPLSGRLAAFLPASATSGTPLLVFCAVLLVVVYCLHHIQQHGTAVLKIYTSEKLILAFRAKLLRHAQRLSLFYHDKKGTSDSTYRIQYDAPAIQWMLIDGLTPFVTAAFTLCGMIYVTAAIDWQLALVALAISPVLALITRAYRGPLRRKWDRAYQLQSSAMSVVQEVLSAVRVVRAFGQEEREHERFLRHSSESVWARIRIAFDEGSFGMLVGLTIAVGTAVVLFIGVGHVRAGALTLGGLLMIMTYLAQLYGPLEMLSSMAAHVEASIVSAERAFSLLDEPPDVLEKPGAFPIRRSDGAVAFRRVAFAYENDRRVLDDISFEIDAGSRVGITGMTGGGKTTLVSLLTRFFDPTAGQILLDGVDLRDYKIADLRNQFAIVLQEAVLFSASIAENIAYARPEATQAEIVAAAKAAHVDDFVARLRGGYDTQVGERGMSLSGGERQRIALARAFLRDAPILILDEPTSSVDMKTEALILDAMQRLMHGRTSFIITHRPGMLKNCHLHLEIENGRLREVARIAAAGGN